MSGWHLRVRLDADGFYRAARGKVVLPEPFTSREAAEEVRRAMPNGAEFEVVMRWERDVTPPAA